MRSRHRNTFAGAVTVATIGLVAACVPVSGPPIDGIESDSWGRTDQVPQLSVAFPTPRPLATPPPGGWSTEQPPPASEPLAHEDFDGDGVANWNDNCLLVPNADQAPTTSPAHGLSESAHAQAVEWKAAHPGAMFRLADELGEACANHNGNWHRTYEAFRLSPQERKRAVYEFLGQGGPMFGDDTLVFSLPICTDIRVLLSLGDFLRYEPDGTTLERLKPLTDLVPESTWDCAQGELGQFLDGFGVNLWAGKHLYTPSNDGGRITNRFFPNITEAEWAAAYRAENPWLFPDGNGQTVEGKVTRGQSFWDGRDAIVLDWRRVAGSGINGFPIANTKLSTFLAVYLGDLGNWINSEILGYPDASYLIYDDCRALSEGFWPCTADIDMVRGDGERMLVNEGWMPWVALDPSIQAYFDWRAAHPEWATPSAYGL